MLSIDLLVNFLLVFSAGVTVGTIFDIRAPRGTYRQRSSTPGGPTTAPPPPPLSTTTPHIPTFVGVCPYLLPIQFVSSPLSSIAPNNFAATVTPYGFVPMAADYLEARAPKIANPRQSAPGSLRLLGHRPLKRVVRPFDRLKDFLVNHVHIIISLQFLGSLALLSCVIKLLADRKEARFQSDHWDVVVERQMRQMNNQITSLTKRVEDGKVLKQHLRKRVRYARKDHATYMEDVERSHDWVIDAFDELQFDRNLLRREVEFYKRHMVELIEAMALVNPDDPLWAGLTAQGAQFPNVSFPGGVI